MRLLPPVSGNQAGSYPATGTFRRAAGWQQTLNWEDHGDTWPNQQASRFVASAGIRWHVQVMGQGPVILLLHGTGASTHSFRELATELAPHHTVVMPDLPGHGFTGMPASEHMSLPGMAWLLERLLQTLELQPQLAVGHSAGAAIAAQMCLNGAMAPAWLVSINGALLPLSGIPGWLYTPIARLLAKGGLWAKLLASSAADRKAVERLIQRTGSVIGPEGINLYVRLLRSTGHTAAALKMMAHWELRVLQRQLLDLRPDLMLLVGDNDLMVPPQQAARLAELLPAAELRRMPDCGHLLHEEQPQRTAALIRQLGQGIEGVLN